MSERVPMTMTKAGVQLNIIASYPDGTKLERTCGCRECASKKKWNRFVVLPCGCHGGLVVECDCRVRERKCMACSRVFVASTAYTVKGKRYRDVFEIEDPHGANAVL